MRKAIFDVIDELNRTFEIQRIAIRGLGWEEYVTPGIGSHAQQVVNEQLLTEYDILIAIFATKLGTLTPNARSGTIDEIEHAIANNKSPMGKYRVQVYFRDKLESTSSLSIDEFKNVIEYREALKPRGILFGMFKEREDLQREIRVNWPAPGSADTELGVLMEPEVRAIQFLSLFWIALSGRRVCGLGRRRGLCRWRCAAGWEEISRAARARLCESPPAEL
jgi:hypothetical protein